MPMAAETQKDVRQPYDTISQVMKGAVSAAPVPVPAKIRPLALPRSWVGIQVEVNWLDDGYITDSPTPSRKRTRMIIQKAPAMLGWITVMAQVQKPHHSRPPVSTLRGPKRLASQPPGIWNRPYPARKAL